MTQVLPGCNPVPHHPFQLLDVGKPGLLGPGPDEAPSRRISKMPPVPGTSVTPRISCSNVTSSSCAIQAARSSHRHRVQYSISIRGFSELDHARSVFLAKIAHIHLGAELHIGMWQKLQASFRLRERFLSKSRSLPS